MDIIQKLAEKPRDGDPHMRQGVQRIRKVHAAEMQLTQRRSNSKRRMSRPDFKHPRNPPQISRWAVSFPLNTKKRKRQDDYPANGNYKKHMGVQATMQAQTAP